MTQVKIPAVLVVLEFLGHALTYSAPKARCTAGPPHMLALALNSRLNSKLASTVMPPSAPAPQDLPEHFVEGF